MRNREMRNFIINDFWISEYDTWVIDRRQEKWFYPKVLTHRRRDSVNLRCSKYLLADTQAHLDYWQEMYGRTKAKTFILPALANRKKYVPSSEAEKKNEKFTVIYFGEFIPLHGLEIIMEAMHEMEKEKKFPVLFQFFGKGQLSERFRKTLMSSSISFFNDKMIPEEELIPHIQRADVVLGIFGSSRKARSVVPNKLYQGLACRKCVITMDSLAVREFFTQDEVKMIPRDAASLKKAIEELFLHPERRNEFAAKGFAAFNRLYDSKRVAFREFISGIVNK